MSIKLTQEEEKLILEKRKLQEQLKTNTEKQDKLNSIKFQELEKEFKIAYDKATEEVQACIEVATKQLEKIESISEKYGIPIKSPIVDIGRKRSYTPTTFYEKWSNPFDKLDPYKYEDLRGEYDLYDCGEFGWQYWSTSSLTC